MTTTPIYLPESLQYPIVITSIAAQPSSTIARGTKLLHYSFEFTPRRTYSPDPAVKAPPPKTEKRFSSWEATSDGVINEWHLRPGQRITLKEAKETPALSVLEECPHSMQMAGLCTQCGKDMTITDYIGITDEARAGIRMTHDAAGPTVSELEARRIEKETADKLSEGRKLILIVDLDQTIVHATVDPTVGEWITQGKAYETRLAEKAAAKAAQGAAPSSEDGDEDTESDSDSEIEVNPNWEMLKDVAQFKLAPEAPARKGRPAVREEPCDYYIKPRPNLSKFLTALKEKYEMHVYTMGTRAYALQVCNVIDPNGSYFGGRILSRDDSGSLTMKHIQRLFPYNSKMVVIIDDRADVWGNSPNLVKVVPYDFFVGIGDINATFLPKLHDPVGDMTEAPAPTAPSSDPVGSPTNGSPDSAVPALAASPHTASPAPPSTEIDMTKGEVEAAIIAEAQSKAVTSQLEERPLAKMQKELDKEEEREETAKDSAHLTNGHLNGAKGKNGREHHHHHKGKALLSNNDWELERVWNILHEVHRRYYEAYDANKANAVALQGKGKQKGSLAKNSKVPDVSFIIPALKSEVLAGTRILFSSVIPLGTPPEQSEAWRCAREFGAKCATKLTDEVTHVVSAKEGTHKVLEAFRKGSAKVVWTKWFNDCIALWKHLEEKGDYLLPMPSKRALDSLDAAATPGSNTGNEVNGEEEEGHHKPVPLVDDTETPGTETGTPIGTPRMPALDLDWDAAQDELDAFLAETDDEGGGDDEKIEGDDEEEDEDEDEGPDREGRGRDFGARDMDELLAEDETMDVSYGEPSGSKPVLKRPRGDTSNSTASDSEDDGTPSAKRTKLAAGPSALNKVVVPDEETDEDEEMTGSKPGSIALSGPGAENDDEDDDDEDEDGDEEEGSSAAEGLDDSASDDESDDSDDDDFLNELSAASDGPG